VHKKLFGIVCSILAISLLGACGLLVGEPFIDPVPQAVITQSFSERSIVDLRSYPTPDDGSAFTNFVIFYRIYVSSVNPSPTTIGDNHTFSVINPTLNSDFLNIHPRIDNEELIGENMHNVFSGRQFRYLALENYDITQVLGREFFARSVGERIIEFDFDFTTGRIPVMRIGSSTNPNRQVYNLLRANSHQGIGAFAPQPEHRRFINSPELRSSENINLRINADVADRSGIVAAERRYTYAAMFIVAVGMSSGTFSNVYSTPAMIHVFRLPDES